MGGRLIHGIDLYTGKYGTYLKGFSKYRKMAFFFFEYLFFVLELLAFLYYAKWESDDVMTFATKVVKYMNKEFLWEY